MSLDMELVEDLLRRQFPKVTRDQDGDLEVTINSDRGYEVSMWARQAGRTGDVLHFTAESLNHQAPRSRWAEAVWVCNQWNQAHFFPRVSLLIPDFASCIRAPAQCSAMLEFHYGTYDVEFLEAQVSHAGSYPLTFYNWLDENPELSSLFSEFNEAQEREHVRRLEAAGLAAGSASFAEEFLIDEGFPRVREPEGFYW